MGFLVRWLFAFVLVALTFNPTEWCFVRWAARDWGTQTPMIVLAGLLLLIGYIFCVTATLRSIGPIGVLLVAAVIAALGWVLYDQGWLSLANSGQNVWLMNLAVSLVLAIGLSWSLVRRQVTGQTDVDDTDDKF